MPQSEERQEAEKEKIHGQASSVPKGSVSPSGTDGDGDGDNSRADWAFLCLVTAARVLGIPADYNQLVRAYPPGDYSELRLLRAAKGLSLKAKKTTGNTDRLDRMPLPALAFMRDGNVKLLIKSSPEKLLIYDPNHSGDEKSAPRPAIVETAKFKEHWSGEAILLARKFTFSAVGEKFGITWFLPVMGRFKRLFGEVFHGLVLFAVVRPHYSAIFPGHHR